MKDSARYVKIVEGPTRTAAMSAALPSGCHGDDEKLVFDELCRIVEDAIEVYRREGKPLPPPTSGRDFANKMQNVA